MNRTALAQWLDTDREICIFEIGCIHENIDCWQNHWNMEETLIDAENIDSSRNYTLIIENIVAQRWIKGYFQIILPYKYTLSLKSQT